MVRTKLLGITEAQPKPSVVAPLPSASSKARNRLNRPVLVLGWISRIVVTVAQSLHRHGIPVDVADFATAPPPTSRAIRNFRYIPRPDVDRKAFVEQLQKFIKDGGHDIVIPSDDQTLVALTEHYDDLKDLVSIACPPPQTTRLILDKYASLELAQSCGIRIPRTKLITNSEQLPALFSSFSFPWFLKPARKEISAEEIKAISLASPEDVSAAFPTAIEFNPPMLLQELCVGTGVGIEILLHEGKCIAVFQHRRIIEDPYTGGVSAIAVSERPDPVLVEKSLALLRSLHWEGPAMVEFKVDSRDGSGIFMEVNGRYWGTISLPVFAGIDFPLYHWQAVHGEVPVVPARYVTGMKWRWTAGYIERFHRIVVDSKHSRAARKELVRTLVRIPASFAPWTRDSLFRFSDPKPGLLEVFRVSGYFLRYDLTRLFQFLFRRR